MSGHGYYYFNPRSHERSDSYDPNTNHVDKHFNPRSHERSDICSTAYFPVYRYFNPRSHERSDCRRFWCIIDVVLFQSTLPREERRYNTEKLTLQEYISIHAPTRGATSEPVTPSTRSRFQSTLPREERHNQFCLLAICRYFNPRSHERSDDLPAELFG